MCIYNNNNNQILKLKIDILLKLFNHANIKDLECLCVYLMCYDEYSILLK